MDAWAVQARDRIEDEYAEMQRALDDWRDAEYAIRDVIEGIGTQADLAEKQQISDAKAKKLLQLVAAQLL